MRRFARALVVLATLASACPAEVATAVTAPSIQAVKTVYADGIATGTVQLSTVATTGLPNRATQAWVESVGDWFDLFPGTSAPAKANVVVNTPDGRQWRRRGVPNPVFISAPFFSVSSTGSDENACWGATQSAADSHPCYSLQEIDRRLTGWRFADSSAAAFVIALTVHVMDDITTAARFAVLHNVHSSSNVYVRVTGGLTPVDGSASNRTITGYQAAVPASNTERQITISGLGTTAQYVGKIIQTTDGGKTAIVMRQPSSDNLSISQVRDNATTGLDGLTATNVSDFTNGDHVTIYTPVRIPAWPFPPSVPFALADRLQFVATSEVWPTSDFGSSYVLMQQCVFGAGADGEPTEYEFHGGDALSIDTSALFSTHANAFLRARAVTFSVGVLVNGDGPFLEGDLSIADEMSITTYRNGGSGWRCQGEHPCNVVVGDTGSVGAFGMLNSIFVLESTHVGVPGNFVGSDSNTGYKSLFYGSGNTGFGVVLAQGSHCKFPKTGITYTTSAHFLNVAGIGITDTFHNYDVADIPVADTATGTWFGDSNPGTSGGRF